MGQHHGGYRQHPHPQLSRRVPTGHRTVHRPPGGREDNRQRDPPEHHQQPPNIRRQRSHNGERGGEQSGSGHGGEPHHRQRSQRRPPDLWAPGHQRQLRPRRASFSISGIGQITVAPGVRLDHEAQATYLGDGGPLRRKKLQRRDGQQHRRIPPHHHHGDRRQRPGDRHHLQQLPPERIGDNRQPRRPGWPHPSSDHHLEVGPVRSTPGRGLHRHHRGDESLSYTPQQADLDKYLQATVTYTDRHATEEIRPPAPSPTTPWTNRSPSTRTAIPSTPSRTPSPTLQS